MGLSDSLLIRFPGSQMVLVDTLAHPSSRDVGLLARAVFGAPPMLKSLHFESVRWHSSVWSWSDSVCLMYRSVAPCLAVELR